MYRRLASYPQFRRGLYIKLAAAAHEALMASDQLEPRGIVLPGPGQSTLAARDTFEARVTVLPGTYLYAVAGSSAQAAGFRVEVIDLGTQTPLFSGPVNIANIAGATAGTPQTQLWRPPKPRVILAPGLLTVRLLNLATVPNDVQVALFIAEPKTL
jgi:hypothetical protein